jgi:LPS export ABC transporter protein LptC
MVNNRIKWIVVILISHFLLSCSFDYEEAIVEESFSEKAPESIIIGLSQTVVKEGQIQIVIEVERAEVYEDHKRTIARGLHFIELDREGGRLAEGWADKAVYYSETEDAEFSGNVYLYSAKEETSISTAQIKWENEERYLSTPEDVKVILKKDDGSFLEGTGFKANLRRREIQFGGGVNGHYIISDEDK